MRDGGKLMPSLIIDLPLEADARLRQAAEQEGQAPEVFAREALIAAVAERARQPSPEELDQLFAGWDERDSALPDPGPPPVIPRLQLRRIDLG
jgi:hypothetical protein